MTDRRHRDAPARCRTRRTTPRTHWLVLSVLSVTLSTALLLQGYTHHMFGITSDAVTGARGRSEAVPAQVAHGGPVIADAAGAAHTARVEDRTIALTFDDGPDPVWTPRILDVLRRNHVHATFFVVGTQVVAHPELVRRIVSEGHQIGIHTFTHPDLARLAPWQRSLELRETQLAVAGAAGVTTALLRPPYSSKPDALDDADWSVLKQADAAGYVTVLSTQDAEDWQRPGVDRILANATPHGHAGQIVLMHDAGGDRSQTVAALSTLIPRLKAHGFQFATVGAAVGMAGPVQPAGLGEHLQGMALVTVLQAGDWAVWLLGLLMYAAGAVSVLRAAVVLVAARRHRRQRTGRRGGSWERVNEPVSVIVPAYNESAGIEAAVRSLLASDHPVEIIVVDDGSTDGTADLVESLRLPGVRVIRQRNAGKPAALNTGLAAATCELVVMVDGDTVFEPGTVRTIVQPFADPRVGAVSGNAKVVNRGGLLGRWQHIEYVVGFNLDRRLFDLAECMPTVPGAVGAFRRRALLALGGVSDATLAEDTDLTMALCRSGWRVVYEEGAVAWTEAPASLNALWRQRYRWCYGTLQAMWKHRGALVQRGAAGKLGRRGLVYLLLFQVLLPLLAPAVDIFAVYGLLFLDPVRIIGLWLAFLLLQLLMGLYAFRLDGERAGPLWSLPLQQFVYRQLMYLVVIQSVFTALSGSRLRWQRMERYGSLRAPKGASPLQQPTPYETTQPY
ncbi:cellulose synthase/poly-beta-1,6-N-acetylglucosamine synthase-like glycosyltransferase/peptidoglycan/xylan/chitin deacetylase (PgdA/CDA1 family) [Streptomyces griseochromogenes]|uniref:Bi-functional transferase/deacetylase n=1 Tax=Streptomyces griseochromogenes TaxID=68214 RepID=A0A1B1APD0_9ACTN|nr:bifunctional polysaccharide deacetylase/glycosyltransferase family 2 protein [Streptomyces griseochromogenes]ANP48370.1 bi-functional transferase/deacetylase [Streptomyces griseochromogenes]MBP2052978.1 cellulose synthase/poly-beta-1,6-N-acetylglucosamine synthase-like glycosyltransferase/peptidoglycan/xylan/chitin deacetylase (PgdA/CDA1 family) [Streptomyces griseochromogenes]